MAKPGRLHGDSLRQGNHYTSATSYRATAMPRRAQLAPTRPAKMPPSAPDTFSRRVIRFRQGGIVSGVKSWQSQGHPRFETRADVERPNCRGVWRMRPHFTKRPAPPLGFERAIRTAASAPCAAPVADTWARAPSRPSDVSARVAAQRGRGMALAMALPPTRSRTHIISAGPRRSSGAARTMAAASRRGQG